MLATREGEGEDGRQQLRQWESQQVELKKQMVDHNTEDWQSNEDFAGLERVGGVDLSFIKEDEVNACASLVVLSYPDLEVIYEECRMVCLNAPYIPGFLAFREAPFLEEAVRRLQHKDPSLLPQIKDLHERGNAFTLTGTSGKVLGMALKSCEKSTKPIYVSVGHRISLDTASRLTHSCCKYRVPEPIRQADIRSREYIRRNANTS
ncbi:endonuclease V isoform X4 [Amblyraja radiata]|uniref:endonuclease V isoform X4 n=1 Tax=Amblyraja radiata TaxID=386614 RepID=UPI001402EF60|nr:endonuclease V isoform X4 [Amblyraja radiata]